VGLKIFNSHNTRPKSNKNCQISILGACKVGSHPNKNNKYLILKKNFHTMKWVEVISIAITRPKFKKKPRFLIHGSSR